MAVEATAVRHMTMQVEAPQDLDAFIYGMGPKWIPLRCGHYGHNPSTAKMHEELEQNDFQSEETVSVICSVCQKIVLGRMKYKYIYYIGFGNLISKAEFERDRVDFEF